MEISSWVLILYLQWSKYNPVALQIEFTEPEACVMAVEMLKAREVPAVLDAMCLPKLSDKSNDKNK